MTWNAEPAGAQEIEGVDSSLSSDQMGRMAVEEADGKPFMDQYYITIRATK
jgi:hypothetical protein